MALNVRFVPIAAWPGKATPARMRVRARFKASYAKTLRLLETELGAIEARNVLIQAHFREDQIRNDGWPYARASPSDVGVVLSFTRQGQVVSMPCDRFASFDDNLRAIALSLEALRMVDRYGVTRNGEQYRGFTSLPAPAGSADAAAGIRQASALLAALGGIGESELRKDFSSLRTAYTKAARATHPDYGGSPASFGDARNAYALLARFYFGKEV